MSQDVTATDLFCGAGGSSRGAENAGAIIKTAANHWPIACDTYATNHAAVAVDCADISQVNPRRYERTDILIASPECTNQTGAKAHKAKIDLWNRDDPKAQARFAAEERSRATMWDVVRFSEYHRYELVIIENVVEARKWDLFEPWLLAMHALGYEHRAVFLNSMVTHPTPQSRDRMYVVFWRRGNKAPDLEFRPIAWCASCQVDVNAIQTWKNPYRPWGKYRSQYVYRCPTCTEIALPYAWPAAAAIDWSIPTPRIGDRKTELAPATLARIRAGLERYGPNAIIQAAGHTYERPGYYRTWPTWEPLMTQTGTAQHGLVVDTEYVASPGHVRPTDGPFATQTGRQSQALVVAMRQGDEKRVTPADRDPFATVVGSATTHALLTMRGTSERQIEDSVRALSEPVRTISAGGIHHALLVRQFSGGAEQTRPVVEPAGSLTTKDGTALVMPFLTDYHGNGSPQGVEEPHRTMDTRDRFALVEPRAIDLDDCGFRMLEPAEIGRVMAFTDDYVVLGTKRERVAQYGNAVTPPTMSLLTDAGIESLA